MADAKLTALAANTAPIGTDIAYIVDDPGGSAASQKITFANFGKGLDAGVIPNTPAGAIAATDVQAAIDELESEKSPLAGSASILTVGALDTGSITSGFTSIDVGSGAITTTGAISGGTFVTTVTTGSLVTVADYGGATQATGTTIGVEAGDNFNTNSANDYRSISITNEVNAGAGANTGIYLQNSELTVTPANIGGQGLFINQFGIDGTGLQVQGNNNVAAATNGVALFLLTATQGSASTVIKVDTGTSSQDHLALDLDGTRFSMRINDADQAPGTTTNKAYSLAGVLQWNGNAVLDAASTVSALTTVGVLASGSITTTFGAIDNGASNITTTGTISGGTVTDGTASFTSGALTGATTGVFGSASSLTLGTASTAAGGIIMKNASNANNVTIQAGATSGTYAMTLPLAVAGAGEVLTDAAGNGVLSWAAAGGGGASQFDAEVAPSGADYTTLGAAVADGKTRILISGSVTESGDIALPASDLYIFIEKTVVLTMVTYQFTYAGTRNVYIRGEGEIDYTQTSSGDELFNSAAQAASILDIDGIYFDNNSTATVTALAAGCVMRLRNMIIDCPNTVRGGIIDPKDGSFIQNIEFNGGGTDCEEAIYQATASATTYSNLTILGTWDSAVQEVINCFGAGETIFDNISVTSTSTMILQLTGLVNNIHGNPASKTTDIEVGSAGTVLSNLYDINDLDLVGMDDITITNFECDKLDLSDAGCLRLKISNGVVAEAVTVAGDNHCISNVAFGNNVTISSGGNQNQFSNCDIVGDVNDTGNDNSYVGCKVGARAGGGGATITVVAGANRTRIAGTATDAAIVDGGAGTVTAANTVY